MVWKISVQICSLFIVLLTARVTYNLLHFPDLLKPVLLVSLAIIVQLHVQIQVMESSVYSSVIVGLMKSVTIHMDVLVFRLVRKVQVLHATINI